MDINDLFDGIMKSINQFADEIAEQRLQEKCRKPDEVRRTGVRPEGHGWPKGTAARLVRQDAKPGRRSAMRRISRRKRSGV